MADDSVYKIIQSMIELCASLNKRIDVLHWRLERMEREVVKLNGFYPPDETGKPQIEGGRK